MSQYMCAFLNQRGGKFIIGVDEDFRVVGIPYENGLVDRFKLLVDNHQNGIEPQVKSAVATEFFAIQNSDSLAYVIITVEPGDQRIYYTSRKGNLSFIMSSCGPRQLKRTETIRRQRNDRETCLQIEEFSENFNLFRQDEIQIEQLIQCDTSTSKVILIQGQETTGKRTLVGRVLEQLVYDEAIVYQINLNQHYNINEAFVSLIHQLDPSYEIGQSSSSDSYFRTFQNYDGDADKCESQTLIGEDKKEDQQVVQINKKEIVKEIFEKSLIPLYFVPNSTYFNVYYQLLRKQVLLNTSKPKQQKIVICLYNANRYATQMIPGGLNVIIFITSAKPIFIQQTPSIDVLRLERCPFTPVQLMHYYKCTYQLDLDEVTCRPLIHLTGGDMTKIDHLIQQHGDNLNNFLMELSNKSVRQQKAYFANSDNGKEKSVLQQKLSWDLIQILASLSYFTTFFSLDMYEFVIEESIKRIPLPGTIKQYTLLLNPFLIRHHDKISIPQNVVQYVMSSIQSDFGKQCYRIVIDCIMAELETKNQIYQMLSSSMGQKLSSPDIVSNSMIQLELNTWMADYGCLLENLILMAIQDDYRIIQLTNLINVFAFLRIDSETVRKLRSESRKLLKVQQMSEEIVQ